MCGSEYVRKASGTRNWEQAQKSVVEAEARGYWETPPAGEKAEVDKYVSVEDAISRFLSDAEKGRAIAEPTLRKYRVMFKRMRTFAAKKSIVRLNQFDLDLLRSWRETWELGPRTLQKEIERVRCFFRFCHEGDFIERNPAILLKGPKNIKVVPKLPFTPEEMADILAAAEKLDLINGVHGDMLPWTNDDLITMILVMRYSGLRISDAAMLSADRLDGTRLFLYTQKTGEHVYVPLPPFVMIRLRSMKLRHGKYFFTGPYSIKMETVADMWRRKIGRTMTEAGIVGQHHPHRFRHTFAVELLKDGTPLEDIAILLGHSSVKITERHYAAWVRSRQERLEKNVAKSWERLKVIEGGRNTGSGSA